MVNAARMKAIIDSKRGEIGRYVSFYTSALDPCSLCTASGYYDPATDSTFYFTCPICAGSYYLNTAIETEVLARIHWTNDEAVHITPGGKYYAGDATIVIDPEYLDLAEQTQSDTGKVYVDGHDMQIDKIIPVGAPIINRYKLVLKNMGERPE